jgi:hypothetical protein
MFTMDGPPFALTVAGSYDFNLSAVLDLHRRD